MSKTKIVETFTKQSVSDFGTKLRNCAKLEFRKSGIGQFCAKWLLRMIAQIVVFFAQNWCAKKEKFCVSFRKNCAKVVRMVTLRLPRFLDLKFWKEWVYFCIVCLNKSYSTKTCNIDCLNIIYHLELELKRLHLAHWHHTVQLTQLSCMVYSWRNYPVWYSWRIGFPQNG